jgi:16S rRNA processing protein RimM
MKTEDCYQIGYVVKTHGLKGEVSVLLDVDDPYEYEEMESVFLLSNGNLIPFFIESISMNGDRAIIKFEDINDLNAASKLVKSSLLLPLDQLPSLDDDQFYFHELKGLKVVDDESGDIGTVSAIYSRPGQDLLEVQHQGAFVLIPMAEDIVYKVDKDKGTIYTRLPQGLLELYLEEQAQEPENIGDED